jgi:hypothetical protein
MTLDEVVVGSSSARSTSRIKRWEAVILRRAIESGGTKHSSACVFSNQSSNADSGATSRHQPVDHSGDAQILVHGQGYRGANADARPRRVASAPARGVQPLAEVNGSRRRSDVGALRLPAVERSPRLCAPVHLCPLPAGPQPGGAGCVKGERDKADVGRAQGLGPPLRGRAARQRHFQGSWDEGEPYNPAKRTGARGSPSTVETIKMAIQASPSTGVHATLRLRGVDIYLCLSPG